MAAAASAAAAAASPSAAAAVQPGHWVDTWTTMPQLTESTNLPPPPFNETGLVFFNSTIRQTFHMSIGGDIIRLRFSNNFGVTNLPLTQVTIALPTDDGVGVPTIVPDTLQQVTFSGLSSVSIPNGALIVSDPIRFPIKPQSMITVTLYTAEGQTTNDITSHPGSRTTSWFANGNHVNAANITDPSTQNEEHWFFASAVEVWSPTTSSAFAIVGDSITDGRESTDNGNNR